jgi:hypothetical protein
VRVLALAAVLLFVAGCVGPSTSSSNGPSGPVPAPSKDPAWAVKAIFAGEDPLDNDRAPQHDHTNRTLHKGLSTPNFQVLGHNGIVSGYFEQPAGTYYCGDVSSGPRQIAVVHSFQTDVAIEVLDVTNRSDVKVLGELVLPYVFTYDAAIFSDASYAVIAGNPDLASDKPPIAALREQAEKTGKVPFQPMWRTQCGTFALKSNVDSIPYGYSAILVDLKDPTNPTVASFYEYPGGRNVHSISTAIIDGTHYVVTSGLMAIPCTLPGVTGNPVANPIPCEPQVPRFGNLLSHFDFLTVTDLGGVRAQLTPYLVYTPTDQTHLDPSLLYLSNGHTDATLEKHPVTGQLIAYLADWDGGLHIIRLDGPQQATALADWGQAPGGDPTQMKGHIHSAYPVPGLRDGKHYVVVGQEVVGRPAGRSSGQIDILDVTNPSVVIRGAKWTLPIDVQWPPSQGEMFSTHYPILVNDTLYVSLYHGGVWAADAGKKNWPDLPSIGVFVPDADPAGGVFHGGPTPEVLEVLSLGDGNILVFDGTTGAYTVHFSGPDARVPPVAPWPDNDWIG